MVTPSGPTIVSNPEQSLVTGYPTVICIEEVQGVDVIADASGQSRPLDTAHRGEQHYTVSARGKANAFIEALDGFQIGAGVAGLPGPVREFVKSQFV